MEEKQVTRSQLAEYWKRKVTAANQVFSRWANRFQVHNLYQYYEGYQWIGDTDIANRPYVVNLIYSTIETKLPNLIFNNPEYTIRPRPVGLEFNFEEAAQHSQLKQDVLNYICRRKEFNLNDKHELAVLDAFFGFGVIEIGYDEDLDDNPYIPSARAKNPLNYLYCKQIPFDHFRVAANANWDLSEGKWFGYYEFVPNERLKKYEGQLNLHKGSYMDESAEAAQFAVDGRIIVGELTEDLTPANTTKIWRIWDFEHMKFIKLADENANSTRESILEYETFKTCGICTLRYGKRRKGWYPLPPVFNWLSPQDEINDIRQTHKIHRKRYSRKYLATDNVDQEEMDKFLYGPDGTVIRVPNLNVIKPVDDAPLDTSNQQSLIVSYDDFLRVAGGQTEQGRVADRTTATQANINNRLAQIRESKDLTCGANFMVQIGYNVLRELKNVKNTFWAEIGMNNEQILMELEKQRSKWVKINPREFDEDDYELDVKVSSISPIYQEEDKKAFLEFLSVLTRFEILAFSPGLVREAAYRMGYKNENVLNQFMQMAQLAAIGRQLQLKGQVQQLSSPNPAQPDTQLAQQQVDESTPPDNQQIINQIFNKTGVQS